MKHTQLFAVQRKLDSEASLLLRAKGTPSPPQKAESDKTAMLSGSPGALSPSGSSVCGPSDVHTPGFSDGRSARTRANGDEVCKL